MYNEYPDLIYEGLISDSFYTDIVEEGIGNSIKNGFGRLKEICKKTFDKIIEKLKQFISNVRNYITKLINKFKKKDNNSESSSNEKQNEDTKKEDESYGDISYRENEDDATSNRSTNEYHNSGINKYENEERKSEKSKKEEYTYKSQKRDNRFKSYSNNNYKINDKNTFKKVETRYDGYDDVKVISKYDVNYVKIRNTVDFFKYIIEFVSNNFKILIRNINFIEKEEKSNMEKRYIENGPNVMNSQSEWIDTEMNQYSDFLNKTDDEILSEIISNYNTDKNFEREMKKNESEEFVKNYSFAITTLKNATTSTIKEMEIARDNASKVFEILDKKLKHSTLNKSNFTNEEKKKLKSYRIAGNKAREQYQKVIRFSSLLIKLENILVSNIASIRVVKIPNWKEE